MDCMCIKFRINFNTYTVLFFFFVPHINLEATGGRTNSPPLARKIPSRLFKYRWASLISKEGALLKKIWRRGVSTGVYIILYRHLPHLGRKWLDHISTRTTIYSRSPAELDRRSSSCWQQCRINPWTGVSHPSPNPPQPSLDFKHRTRTYISTLIIAVPKINFQAFFCILIFLHVSLSLPFNIKFPKILAQARYIDYQPAASWAPFHAITNNGFIIHIELLCSSYLLHAAIVLYYAYLCYYYYW